MNAAAASLSLRWRLLGLTLGGIVVALLLAGVVLADLFRQQAERQFEAALRVQLDGLTAAFDPEAPGGPALRPPPADPRWQTPYSGLYWQIDGPGEGGTAAPVRRRSRSLWDEALAVPADVAPDGGVHVHETRGPGGVRLRVVERAVRTAERPERVWMLRVAQDTAELDAAIGDFVRTLALSLGVLAVLLAAAALAQVHLGLAPLRRLQQALADLRAGRRHRLGGDQALPAELAPLVGDFDAVLERHARVVERARTQAGNLAHAIRTPLAVLAAAAADPRSAESLAPLIEEQVAQARREVDRHLARARLAASGAGGMPGQRAAIAPVVAGLVRVVERIHAARHLDLDDRCAEAAAAGLQFAGEAQDLQEMVGNLLDNACKWARTSVRTSARVEARGARGGAAQEPVLCIVVEDDGPGLDEDSCTRVLARGVRADEQVPGSGLGLSIVDELARLHGGSVTLDRSPELGGLRATLRLRSADHWAPNL